MKVKNHRGHHTGKFSWNRRSKETSQFGFRKKRTERVWDNLLVRGGCEDELSVSTCLNSEASLLPHLQEQPAGGLMLHPMATLYIY